MPLIILIVIFVLISLSGDSSDKTLIKVDAEYYMECKIINIKKSPPMERCKNDEAICYLDSTNGISCMLKVKNGEKE